MRKAAWSLGLASFPVLHPITVSRPRGKEVCLERGCAVTRVFLCRETHKIKGMQVSQVSGRGMKANTETASRFFAEN